MHAQIVRSESFRSRYRKQKAGRSGDLPALFDFELESVPGLMLGRFRAAHYQFPAQELLIVQFLHGPFGFLDSLHLDKGKAFGALIVPITDYLGVLDVSYTVEQFEQVALSRIK